MASCGLQKKANMNLYFLFFFKYVILFPLSSFDAGKNSSLGAVSGNPGEKSDPHQEKAEGGIHYKVTLWFKCSSLENRHLLAFTLPSLSALLRTLSHTSPAYYLRFVKIHFTLTGIFQPSKPVLICLTSQSSSNSVKSAKPASHSPPLPNPSKHSSSCATDDLSKINQSLHVTCHTLKW